MYRLFFQRTLWREKKEISTKWVLMYIFGIDLTKHTLSSLQYHLQT